MAGQGRPRRWPGLLCRHVGPMLLAALCMMPTIAALRAEPRREAELPSTMRLRITFGGGAARLWHGSISLSDGEFARPELLGLEPDEPGSMSVGVRLIQIRQPSPRSYDGLDVSVRAPLDARLRIRLAAAGDAGEGRRHEFVLADLIAGVHPAGGDAAGLLDDSGNRLVLSRAPGDMLRIAYDRPSLVLSPRDAFRFTVKPHLLGMGRGTDLRMKLRIVSRLSGAEQFSREKNVRVDEEGNIEPWGPHEFAVPEGDGVYNLHVTLEKSSIFDPLAAANPLSTAKPVAQRQLQFVALAADAPWPLDPPHEELVDEFDPVTTNWTERVARLPLLKRLPRMRGGRLAEGEVRVARHLGRQWIELGADAWQAHPLSIDAPGQPYVLEVEYPDNVPQTLGISIIQPNAVGKVAPLGVDSAVEVEPPPAGAAAGVGKHRLVFWPRSRTPVLLLTSLDAERAGVFGRVRIYRYSHRLIPRRPRKAEGKPRLVAAWLDKPLMPEMFSATEAADSVTGRSLDDWRTFYEAGTRFAQYLHFAGYNAAVMPALCEGSSLYPSAILEPTPKYDTGIYLSDGQDPARKDVLELMFRLFDREGLTLFPSVQFNTPLPELERLRLADPRARVGLELVDHQGRSWAERHRPGGGLAPYYNPLDERVQAAMTRVVSELADRYAHHPSFGGVVVQLSPDGYAMLPGGGWGLDNRTFARFARAADVEDPGGGRNPYEQRARWCVHEGREKWLDWRCAQMAGLYQSMAEAVQSRHGEAVLILAGGDMLNTDPMRAAGRPSLSGKPSAAQPVRQALLEMGLDAHKLQTVKSLTLVIPHPAAAGGRAMGGFDWDEEALKELHKQLGAGGALVYRPPLTRRLASFDAASPFGKANTHTWLAAQVSSSGDAARRRWLECLARNDYPILMDGGWMLPRGQEDAQLDLLATLRHLPRGAMSTAASVPATQPVVVRTLSEDRRTVACILNPSPWPVQVRLQTKALPPCAVSPLLPGGAVPPLDDKFRWTLQLPPYDVVAGVFNRADVELVVEHVQLPPELAPALAEKLHEFRRRSPALRAPSRPLTTPNAGFEERGELPGEVPGWLWIKQEGVETALVERGHGGSRQALKIVSRGPEAWVRSQPLAAPKTGRVAVWARLRTPDPLRQPELRLAIEARRGRQPYYRFANVGAGASAAPLADGWAPFILQIDDLPREGLEEFRIGFDLMGAGEAWIDDVEVYEVWFTEQEQFQISRLIAAADFHLREGNHAAAAQALDGYWPRFVLEHVTPARPETVEIPVLPPPPPATNDTPSAPPRQSMLDWLRGRFR